MKLVRVDFVHPVSLPPIGVVNSIEPVGKTLRQPVSCAIVVEPDGDVRLVPEKQVGKPMTFIVPAHNVALLVYDEYEQRRGPGRPPKVETPVA